MNRIRGLDSIRLICALIVVFGHLGIVSSEPIGQDVTWLDKILHAIVRVLFNGPAAVIVFFVISGFCIHFPFRREVRIEVVPFYARRLIRIGIPALSAIALSSLLNHSIPSLLGGVTWSVGCEVVYYLLYPALIYARNRVGWISLIGVAYAAAFGWAVVNVDLLRSDRDYIALGYSTWLIGLPCWLLGCLLAERYGDFCVLTQKKIFAVRAFVLIISMTLVAARFHTSAILSGNVFSLDIFAIAAFIWLGLEIIYSTNRRPLSLTEWGGKWSYSIYLIHPAVPAILALFGIEQRAGAELPHLILLVSTFAISYTFYLLVEKTSHQLASKVGSHLKLQTGQCGNVGRLKSS